MASGAGRGRGWLNLNKNTPPPKPLGLSQPPLTRNPSPPPATSEHQELINRIGKISLSDDGIKFNQKMRFIQEYWLKECSGREEVEASFEDLYNACLHKAELGSQLVALMASQTFISQLIHGCDMRRQFLKHLQKDIENSNQLHTTNPVKFRNCVHMLGEFYNKAKLANGEPYSFLGLPFISCMSLLLTSKNLPDLILFTNQLYLNGAHLKTVVPEELGKLGIKIRIVITTEPQLVPDAKLWLLLALDLFSVRFGLLSADVYTYYESQLGTAAIKHIQSPVDALSIQTVHTSKVLDSYQSNVNVLQISTSPTEAPPNDVQGSHYTNQSEYNGTQHNSFPKDGPKSKEKTGRPILGAGARFINKNKGSEDNNGGWNSKQNSSSSRTHSKKHPPNVKTNKGWEHDDRFETDYN